MINKIFIPFVVLMLLSCTTDKASLRKLDLPKGKAPKETTYYLIRHAEKLRDSSYNGNPQLSEKGFKRSKFWGEFFEDKELDLFYSTDYMRTFQTIIPIVYPYKGDVKYYKPSDSMFNAEFWNETYGKTSIIVGHSNTTPQLVNQIIGESKYKDIPDTINHRLYKIVVDKKGSIVLDTFYNKLIE